MADDYEYDVDPLDVDGEWLYVEDEFDLADELAEGQVADPGYSGTKHEIDMDSYDSDWFCYWDDLEYADDSYWEDGLPGRPHNGSQDGQKRKRADAKVDGTSDKRRRTATRGRLEGVPQDRDVEPLLFRSRQDRNCRFWKDAPLLETKVKFAFMADWRERFADVDGQIVQKKMPVAMQRAAEAQEEATVTAADSKGDWEDDDCAEETTLDPAMLQTILKERLGSAGLDGMDEAAFMQTIQKMMSGQDAAGELANSLLGRLTSDTGDEKLSGWLSQQGVALEGEDDEASTSTADRPDSVPELHNVGGKTIPLSMRYGSPSGSTKRAAPESDQPARKRTKTKVDVPSASPVAPQPTSEGESELRPGEESLVPISAIAEKPSAGETVSSSKVSNNSAAKANRLQSYDDAAEDTGLRTQLPKMSRKRSAIQTEETEGKPAAKKARSRELKALGPLPDAPSPAPPGKRTRGAKAKSGK